MLGIDYSSSDEDDVAPPSRPELTNLPVANAPPKAQSEPTALEQVAVPTGPVNGPSQGPEVTPPPPEDALSDHLAPGSPSALNRVLIQNLTLPTIPNFNIPPSPPGSPPQKATKKFAQFLELKKKGQHFNQRLEGSSVLRDPGHLQKMMDFAGISQQDSYTSSLSQDVGVLTIYPDWAYVEELKASQRRITKAKELGKSKGPREAVQFVSATKSGASSGTGTPLGKGSQQSATDKAIGTVDDDLSGRWSAQTASKRKALEHRGRDDSTSRMGLKSRSRSPKRRRSRSRDRV